MKKILRYLALVPLFLYLQGCIQLEEVTQLAADGSAKVQFMFRIPLDENKDKNKQLKEDLEKQQQDIEKIKQKLSAENTGKKVKIENASAELKDGYARIAIRYFAPRLNDLKEFYKDFDLSMPGDEKSAQKAPVEKKKAETVIAGGDFEIKKLKNGNILITRFFTPPPPEKKKVEKEKSDTSDKDKEKSDPISGLGSPESMLYEMMSFRFELIVPTEVVSSNAHQQVGQSLRWVVNMGTLMNKPFKMTAEIKANPELEKLAK